jgi:hypothetical protein
MSHRELTPQPPELRERRVRLMLPTVQIFVAVVEEAIGAAAPILSILPAERQVRSNTSERRFSGRIIAT